LGLKVMFKASLTRWQSFGHRGGGAVGVRSWE